MQIGLFINCFVHRNDEIVNNFNQFQCTPCFCGKSNRDRKQRQKKGDENSSP